MRSPVLSKDFIQVFLNSGWRQFFLDEHLNISPPCTSLAELCGRIPHTLEGIPLFDLFEPLCSKELYALFTQQSPQPPQTTSFLAFMVQPAPDRSKPVEIMLYSSLKKNLERGYIGFVRFLPDAFMSQVAKAAQLRRSKNRQLEAVAQFSRRMATIVDLDELLDYAVKSLSQNFEYQYTTIFLADADGATITLKAISNMDLPSNPPRPLKLPIKGNTVVGHVIETGESLLVNDGSRDDYELTRYLSADIRSELAVPLVLGEEVLGVLDVQTELTNSFTIDDLSLLQTVAGQLALVLENAHLLEERDRRMAELAALNQIGMVIAKHQNLERILHDILCRVNALFQIEAISLMLLENDNLRFAVAVGAGANTIQSFTLKPGQGIAWSVVETRQTIRVDHVEEDPRHFSDIDLALNFTTRSLLAVPVQLHDRMLGVIEAMNRLDGRPFSRDDEVTLEFIASSIAVIIENARLFEEIEEADRLKTELVQNVSHELRMPLTFVKAYVELILEGDLGKIPPKVKEKLEIVSQKSYVMSRLVEDVITLQHLEIDDLLFEEVNPYDLVAHAKYRSFASATQHGIEIVLECLPDLPKVSVDVNKVEQVFDNLLDNAIKFSPTGSKVIISAESGRDVIKFSVTDQGIGIPPDKLDRIFEKFYQVDGSTTRRYGGIGLGLAIVREIIEAHQGHIIVHSDVGKGSSFSFSLPISKNTIADELA